LREFVYFERPIEDDGESFSRITDAPVVRAQDEADLRKTPKPGLADDLAVFFDDQIFAIGEGDRDHLLQPVS
jgi:hypothetical protein